MLLYVGFAAVGTALGQTLLLRRYSDIGGWWVAANGFAAVAMGLTLAGLTRLPPFNPQITVMNWPSNCILTAVAYAAFGLVLARLVSLWAARRERPILLRGNWPAARATDEVWPH